MEGVSAGKRVESGMADITVHVTKANNQSASILLGGDEVTEDS